MAGDVTVTYLYYILYVFNNQFWRIADIIIAFTIYRTIRKYFCMEQNDQVSNLPSQARSPASALDRPFRLVSIGFIVVLTLMTTAAYAAGVASLVRIMLDTTNYDPDYDSANGPSQRLSFAYFVLYVIYMLISMAFVGIKLKGRIRSVVRTTQHSRIAKLTLVL